MSALPLEAPSTAVVVCAYTEQRWDDLIAAVTEAKAQLRPDDQLLLVIDHNETLRDLAQSQFPGVTVMANERTRGLSGARNTAIDKVSAEIVVFLDDDAVPRPGWLRALVAPYADAGVFAVGGRAIPSWPADARPAHLPPELDWVVGCSYEGMPTERGPIRNLMGCNMSFRREVFDLVGGFDEGVGRVGTVPLGCEETQLCIKLRQARPEVQIVFEPAALVDHTVTDDRVTWRYLRRRAFAEGISKAVISAGDNGVGNDALSSEMTYGRKVLPAALRRETTNWLAGDLRGRAGAAAIPLTLGSFAAGFASAKLRRTAEDEMFTPIFVGELDITALDEPFAVPVTPELPYATARLLVRDGRRVLGQIDVAVTDGEITPAHLREATAGLERPGTAEAHPRSDEPVAVVIATAGRSEQAARCVSSILDGSRVPDEIVLVDNLPAHEANAAALRAIADSADSRGIVRYVAEPTPGASRARNTGVAASSAPVVAFTDDDTVVDHFWLENLLAQFAATPEAGLVTGLVMPGTLDTSAQVWFENLGGFGKGFEARRFTRDGASVHPLFPYAPGMVGSGNNMAARRDTWLQLGGMSDELGPGTPTRSAEDLDLYLRYLLDGGVVSYTPDAVVWHEHRADESALLDQVRGYGVGLSAMFTRLAVDRPHEIRPLARRVGHGTRRLVGGRRQTVGDTVAPPRSTARAELAGLVRGPLALRRSRRANRRLATKAASR